MTISTHAIRWGIFLTALWAIAVLLSFTPPTASANAPSTPVVVLEGSDARLRQAPRNQYAVENLKSNRWTSNRWTSNRRTSNRWTSNRWTRVGRGFVMSGRKWNPSV